MRLAVVGPNTLDEATVHEALRQFDSLTRITEILTLGTAGTALHAETWGARNQRRVTSYRVHRELRQEVPEIDKYRVTRVTGQAETLLAFQDPENTGGGRDLLAAFAQAGKLVVEVALPTPTPFMGGEPTLQSIPEDPMPELALA